MRGLVHGGAALAAAAPPEDALVRGVVESRHVLSRPDAKEDVGGPIAHLLPYVPNRGDARLVVARLVKIVEARHAKVPRDGKPLRSRRLADPDRDVVVRADYRVGKRVPVTCAQPCEAVHPALELVALKIKVPLVPGDALLVQKVAQRANPRLVLVVVLRPHGKPELPAPVHLVEVLYHLADGGVVVDPDVVKVLDLVRDGDDGLSGLPRRPDHELAHLRVADVV